MWMFLLEIMLKGCQKPSGKDFKEKFSWLDRKYQANFDAG